MPTLRPIFFVALCSLLVCVLSACQSKRDSALVELYQDGIQYLESTHRALRAAKTAEEAATVAENALPPLKVLVERKKRLEAEYPELRDSTRREQIHSSFPQFAELRNAARALFSYGNLLAKKYKDNERFRRATRAGWEMLAYF